MFTLKDYEVKGNAIEGLYLMLSIFYVTKPAVPYQILSGSLSVVFAIVFNIGNVRQCSEIFGNVLLNC